MSAFIKNTSAVMTSGGINNPTQESISYVGYVSGTNPVVFKTKDVARSNESSLITGTTSRFTVLKPCNVTVTAALDISGSGSYYGTINHYDVANNVIKGANIYGTSTQADMTVPLTTKANTGDYFIVQTNGTPVDGIATFFSITASAVEAIQPNFVVNLPTSKDNNKTYTEVQVSVTGTNLSSYTAKLFPYRTISKTTNLPVWRLAGNIRAQYSSGLTSGTLVIAGITTSANQVSLINGVTVLDNYRSQSYFPAGGGSILWSIVTPQNDFIHSFDIELTGKPTWADEWIEPGCFVGQVPLDYQYDLTVTGSGWTTTRAVGVVYKLGGGQYRMRGNINGSVTGTTGSLTISGVTFKSIADQAVTISDNASGGSIVDYCWADKNASTISWGFSVSAGSVKILSFDVELESKPSWAVNTI